MRKKTAPVHRKSRMPSAIDIAYRVYVLKALRRFELEGESEATSQDRTPMSPSWTVEKQSMSN